MPSRWSVSPEAFRRVTQAAVVALVLTVISGAAVRLTGSGLGCSTWPRCDATSVVAPMQFHAWVEFGNRLINAAVTVASIGAFVAARRRAPRRRDLTWLAFGLVIGLLAEVVLGGIVVYAKLNPVLVSVHFLLGLAFLALAVVLQEHAGRPDGAVGRPVVGRRPRMLAGAGMGALAVVAALGTVVTSTGPHGGSPGTPRYHLSLHTVAQVHGTAVELYLALTVATLWVLVRGGAPAAVLRRAEVMLVVMAAQAAVGYTQYLAGDPVGVVALHVAGASILIVAAVRFYLGLWEWPAPQPAPPEPVVAAALAAQSR